MVIEAPGWLVDEVREWIRLRRSGSLKIIFKHGEPRKATREDDLYPPGYNPKPCEETPA